ncbi:MAG: Dam family site-specific DNA-(adenine-N6)-methyltransferase [Symploca sp. SIO2G7]|nr:Dam family site-specific DNA-(adenine-N6)-methyltransferase [Symploca sp. SIO2G7]
MEAVTLFSGGGGVDAGLLAAGIKPVVAVEYDPSKPNVSKAIADCYALNFSDCRLIKESIQEVAAKNFPEIPRDIDVWWASPPCTRFSLARGKACEQLEDIEIAEAIVKAVCIFRPKHFFLENVHRYKFSDSFSRIYLSLRSLGYAVEQSLVKFSNYGIPQTRERLLLRASCTGFADPLPPYQSQVSWYDAISDLIPGLPSSNLLPAQQKSLEKWLAGNKPEPVLIKRIGRGANRVKSSSKFSFTIQSSNFSDQKGRCRGRVGDIWLPDGTVKRLTIECARRLQTFPDWYQLPKSVAIAGRLLGNAVPPKFVELLFKNIKDYAATEASIRVENGNNWRQLELPLFSKVQKLDSEVLQPEQRNSLPITRSRREFGERCLHSVASASDQKSQGVCNGEYQNTTGSSPSFGFSEFYVETKTRRGNGNISANDTNLDYVKPFLKWLGSKRWAVDRVAEIYLSYKHRRFVDLTLGSGAIPLALQPERVLACDANPQLIQLWKWVQADGKFIIPLVSEEEYFYQCRDRYNTLVRDGIGDPELPQLLYLLCRTSFNGLHRSSSRKAFNAPWGKYKKFTGQIDLSHYKNIIGGWEFKAADFREVLKSIRGDDFVIFDPPYDSHDGKAFTSYTSKFTRDDQVESAELLAALEIPVIAFNADTPFIREIYGRLGFSVEEVEVKRSVSCRGNGRNPAIELFLTKNV